MAVAWYTWIVLVATALGASIAPGNHDVIEKSACGRVWVTVHSPEVIVFEGELLDAVELNWDFGGCSAIPNKIGLFDNLPTDWSKALVTYNINIEKGYIITRVPLGHQYLPAGWDTVAGSKGPQCLWPWVGSGNERIDSYNCLKIQPTWMEDNLQQIKDLRIGELAVPGTHNAGAWRFNTEVNQATRDRFVLCQDKSIWAQLVHGIRYFDFRIAYYDFYPRVEDRYWLNHNLIRVRPLVPLLREIRLFLNSTKEVIFLDAHHFPIGFYDQENRPIHSVHAGLLALVRNEIGPHLAAATSFENALGSRGPKLDDLITENKRLVFSYVDNIIVSQNDWLWPSLPHLWANTNNAYELFDYLEQAISTSPRPNARSPMYSAMAQTTPSFLDVLLLRGSLRENANQVNRNVTRHLSTTWRKHVNIVSTDFFLGNDVIDVSIALNLERGNL